MKKVFITGASSLLGKKLIETLEKDYSISVLVHKSNPNFNPKIKIVKGGMENIYDWEENLSEIDILFHLAGSTHANTEVYQKINSEGTKELIEAAKRHDIKKIIFYLLNLFSGSGVS